jgi:hypothetical protein
MKPDEIPAIIVNEYLKIVINEKNIPKNSITSKVHVNKRVK